MPYPSTHHLFLHTNAENKTANQHTKTNDTTTIANQQNSLLKLQGEPTKTASQQKQLHKLQGEHQHTEPTQRKLHAKPRAHPPVDKTIQNPVKVTYVVNTTPANTSPTNTNTENLEK